jgi:hypothetical protein
MIENGIALRIPESERFAEKIATERPIAIFAVALPQESEELQVIRELMLARIDGYIDYHLGNDPTLSLDQVAPRIDDSTRGSCGYAAEIILTGLASDERFDPSAGGLIKLDKRHDQTWTRLGYKVGSVYTEPHTHFYAAAQGRSGTYYGISQANTGVPRGPDPYTAVVMAPDLESLKDQIQHIEGGSYIDRTLAFKPMPIEPTNILGIPISYDQQRVHDFLEARREKRPFNLDP